jgi:flagellar L-ring protein precursor FlgH
MTRLLSGLMALLLTFGTGVGAVRAEDLYKGGGWPSLASDRQARQVGDSLTVLIYETSTATNSTQSGSKKSGRLTGQWSVDGRGDGGDLALGGETAGSGQTGRSGRIVGQISVVVDAVLPNGDLHVAGQQLLKVNGQISTIRLSGRVRPADISSDNVVVSNRLAEASIEYGGAGFKRPSTPGVVKRLLSRFGRR